ncbi:unannotated protein [freshwater metagenome]|uniref:Unannotated protein n=1 Tax=freshwater metagenome TaxID=449393 RepID=A0A6J7EUJ0_9ZZZZ
MTCAIALFSLSSPAHASSAPRLAPRVVNGEQAESGRYPFVVALLDTSRLDDDGAFQSQFCGGSLTTPTTVVTAAHCIVDERSGASLAASEVAVAFGSDLRASGLRIVRVAKIAVHPRYDSDAVVNDVAVITLSEPVTDVAFISPLRDSDGPDYARPAAAVSVLGWGNQSTSSDSYPGVMRIGNLVVFPDASCGRNVPYRIGPVEFDGFNRGEADDRVMVCAAGVTPAGKVIDSCQGDSGGPLIGGAGAALRLVGLVSWGENCGTAHPGVYTRVSAMTDFLLEQGAISIVPPTVPPALKVDVLSGAARVTFATTPDGSTISTLAATATNPATGEAATCYAAPRRDRLPAFCTIEGLVNGTGYSISGISANAIGNSPAAAPVVVTPTAVPIPGRILRAATGAGGLAAFAVSPSDGNGSAITSLRVTCVALAGGSRRWANVLQGRARLTGLGAARYSCSVDARNAVGVARSNPRLVVGRG